MVIVLSSLQLAICRLRLCPLNAFGHSFGRRLAAVEQGELNFCADIVMPHVSVNARGLRIDKMLLFGITLELADLRL